MAALINSRLIEVKSFPHGNRWYLYVNGVHIGMTFDEKMANSPEVWAVKQLKARLKTIDRNLERLDIEKAQWLDEQDKLREAYTAI